jgi:hypothetical protein
MILRNTKEQASPSSSSFSSHEYKGQHISYGLDNIFLGPNQLWKFLQFVAFGHALLAWLSAASAATRHCNAGVFWGGGSVHLDFIGVWPVHMFARAPMQMIWEGFMGGHGSLFFLTIMRPVEEAPCGWLCIGVVQRGCCVCIFFGLFIVNEFRMLLEYFCLVLLHLEFFLPGPCLLD